EPSTRGVELPLREQHAAEIVARLRVIRLECQHLLVELDSLVRLSVVLVPDGLAEQTACGRRPRWSAGIDADALALHSHGSALLSIHPKFPAPADGHVIATCASSLEQAAGGVGFDDVGERKSTHRARGFRPRTRGPAISKRTARHRPRQPPLRATSTFEERGSPWRFRQIYLARVADTDANQGIN